MTPDKGLRLGRHKAALKAGVVSAALMPVLALPAVAQERVGTTLLSGQDPGTLVSIAFFVGATGAAVASAIAVIRDRARTTRENTGLRQKVAELGSRNATLSIAANGEGQAALVWNGDDQRPELIGRLDSRTGAPDQRAAFLAFGRWLEPVSATELEHHLETLRSTATRFSMVATSRTGVPVEVRGSLAGSGVIARFTSLDGERERAETSSRELDATNKLLTTLHTLLEATGQPAWLSDHDGNLLWASRAYLDACEVGSGEEALQRGTGLFGGQSRDKLNAALRRDGHFRGELSTVVGGQRVVFATQVIQTANGSAGLAEDRTEAEQARRELAKMVSSHVETLDELTTAVAMFDERQRLRFHNSAFRQLWGLDSAFLEQNPDADMFLNRLRSDGKLPEQPDFKRWKTEMLAAFQALETVEHWWYLPDSQTIRVVANPHPKGGLTWVFENLTERIDLESRYKTLMRVQTETIDHLSEGVAVFSADGILQLCNPAFRMLGHIGVDMDDGQTVHICQIAAQWKGDSDLHAMWQHLAGSVTGFEDGREAENGRVMIDDQVINWSTAPLPNGQTMLTLRDITGPEQIQQALRERNDALERTDKLRNRFIEHVSYELRAPLTTIKGFAELLAMPSSGPLNERQAEYLDHIQESSGALTAVTDAILDLATVDAGLAEIDAKVLDIESVLNTAVARHQDRVGELDIRIDVQCAADIGRIHADEQRIHQVLDNILTNAIDFAPMGSVIHLNAARATEPGDGVLISVRDHGPGIAPKYLDDAFERFETMGKGRNRGAGLGLSIVKSFVELHGGTVSLDSAPNWGTQVRIFLPAVPDSARVAAQ